MVEELLTTWAKVRIPIRKAHYNKAGGRPDLVGRFGEVQKLAGWCSAQKWSQLSVQTGEDRWSWLRSPKDHEFLKDWEWPKLHHGGCWQRTSKIEGLHTESKRKSMKGECGGWEAATIWADCQTGEQQQQIWCEGLSPKKAEGKEQGWEMESSSSHSNYSLAWRSSS